MSMTATTAEALKNMVTSDTELCKELGASSTREEFANTLTTAALTKGIVVDQSDLMHDLDIAFKQYADNTSLTDEELDGVTGGILVPSLAITGLIVVVAAVASGFVAGGIMEYYRRANR